MQARRWIRLQSSRSSSERPLGASQHLGPCEDARIQLDDIGTTHGFLVFILTNEVHVHQATDGVAFGSLGWQESGFVGKVVWVCCAKVFFATEHIMSHGGCVAQIFVRME